MPGPPSDVIRAVQNGQRFLVASHYNPDGDAIGATAAMGWLLTALGKQVDLYNRTGLPKTLDWVGLPAALSTAAPRGAYDAAFVLDCGDLERIGPELTAALDPKTIVNIDHHLGNPLFGAVNWIDPAYSSAGEMVADVARELGVPLTGGLAQAVYLSIVTDTGYFSYSNTGPRSLETAAELLRLGLDTAALNASIQNQWSLERIHLWSESLGRATLYCNGQLGLIRIMTADLVRTGTTVEDCEGLINFVARVRGVRVAVSLREHPGLVKFSLRSNGAFNVQAIAAEFGGGGHRNAAGGHVPGSVEHAETALVAACAKHLEQEPA
ncbi:MAG: bifunctional oligoribonuclease/PAP phosphatase NrnA [Desulfovibrionaceae bacterium]|nr:bifunctional oligoribonuclease/PAP phosphatase NrnA [Desulfovibrionaceae bacterium]MBF0514972.1 bifunctional oligoribonuclease/PAP phosphatase NrnA [Desulfovibrionaceae bacterium]